MDTWKKFSLDTNVWRGEVASPGDWNSAIAYVSGIHGHRVGDAKRHLLSSKRGECYGGNVFGLYSEYQGETLAAFFEKNGMLPCAHCDGKGFWPAADASSVVTVFCSHCDAGVKAQAEHLADSQKKLENSLAETLAKVASRK